MYFIPVDWQKCDCGELLLCAKFLQKKHIMFLSTFLQQEATTANSDPNKLWKQPVSDYFLPKQNVINQEWVGKKMSSNTWLLP